MHRLHGGELQGELRSRDQSWHECDSPRRDHSSRPDSDSASFTYHQPQTQFPLRRRIRSHCRSCHSLEPGQRAPCAEERQRRAQRGRELERALIYLDVEGQDDDREDEHEDGGHRSRTVTSICSLLRCRPPIFGGARRLAAQGAIGSLDPARGHAKKRAKARHAVAFWVDETASTSRRRRSARRGRRHDIVRGR